MMCVNARLGLYSHVFNQNPPLFIPLSDSVSLLVVVILLNGKNTQFLCSHFGWQLDDFICGKINLSNFIFLSSFYSNVSYTYDAQFLTELIGVRDSEYQVLFSDNSNLSPSELGSILLSVATSRS